VRNNCHLLLCAAAVVPKARTWHWWPAGTTGACALTVYDSAKHKLKVVVGDCTAGFAVWQTVVVLPLVV
jgi:hypothetical protein